jgi:glycosyltransferase involved in cell wall biosynthesis
MTENAALISVIMPVYNGEKFIRETIDTVLKQTYSHFEFIIVNDGSTDSTQQIINSYDDVRIIPLHLSKNQGVSNARNMGTDLSKGAFIAFCDADDIYDPSRLEIQLEFLTNNPNIDVCGSYFTVFENGQEHLIKHPLTDCEIKEHFFTTNCIGQPSVMGKSAAFRKFKYNPELEASEDYDLWARMASGGIVFANVPHSLVKYRLHPTQASKTKGRLLYLTSLTICTNYALSFLNSNAVTEYSKAKEITLVDFKKFVADLSISCANKSKDINTFRSLIALQYKKINTIGISSLFTLKMIAWKYHLNFPRKYLLNILLLSFIRTKTNSSLFDTLTKLKL